VVHRISSVGRGLSPFPLALCGAFSFVMTGHILGSKILHILY
jgi:hypothetical protein